MDISWDIYDICQPDENPISVIDKYIKKYLLIFCVMSWRKTYYRDICKYEIKDVKTLTRPQLRLTFRTFCCRLEVFCSASSMAGNLCPEGSSE